MSVIAPEPMPDLMFATPQRRRQSAFVTIADGAITDGMRQDTPLQGDGVSPLSAIGLWAGKTNYIPNGGVESNLTDIGVNGAGTVPVLTRDATFAKFGSASAKLVCQGDGASQGVIFSTTANDWAAGEVGYGSVWLYQATGSALNFTISLGWRNSGGGALTAADSPPISVPSGVWTRISYSGTAPASTARCWIKVFASGTVGSPFTFWADGCQAEKASPLSPYIETNGGNASRTSPTVTCLSASMLTAGQGWVACRMNMLRANTSQPQEYSDIWRWNNGGGVNDMSVFYRLGGLNQWYFQRYASSVLRQAVKPDNWSANATVTIICKWTTTTVSISVDGSAFTTTSFGSETASMGSAVPTLGSYNFNTNFLWFAMGTGTLADADAATINALGNVGNQPAVFPGSCKFYWQGLNAKALVVP